MKRPTKKSAKPSAALAVTTSRRKAIPEKRDAQPSGFKLISEKPERLTDEELFQADWWYMHEITRLFVKGHAPTKHLIIRAIQCGEVVGECCVFLEQGFPLEVWRFKAEPFRAWCRMRGYVMHGEAPHVTGNANVRPKAGWLTTSDAARRLCQQMDNTMTFEAAKTRISKACSKGIVSSEGGGRDRRINPQSLDAYILKCRNKGLEMEDPRR